MFLPLCIQAQTIRKISISGIVNAGSPIDAADCFLKNNQHLGTLTDSLGYFHFKFPQTFLYDTLIISALGFEQQEVALSSIDLSQDTVYFYLEQQSIVLNEVLIESEGYNLKKLVLRAVANIPRNYPNERHQMKGLYRKVSTAGAGYTHLQEAAITVEDHGYKMSTSLTNIQTEFFRETNDWGDVDSLHVAVSRKISERISQHLNTVVNPLMRLYESNFIRHYNKEDTWFDLKSMKKYIHDYYTFELMDVSVLSGDTIYQIALATTVTPPPPKHVSGRSYLEINLSDFAIVEMQFTLGVPFQSIMSLKQVKFQKQHGRYYPSYIRSMTGRNINRNFEDDEYDIHTFWFDDVRVGKFKKIKSAEADDPYDARSHKRNTESLHFWDSTALIKRYPLEEGIRRDLEKYQPLDEQFRENSRD